jgi:hypothetical protein
MIVASEALIGKKFKVKCIKEHLDLTLGKEYDVCYVDGDTKFYLIENDRGIRLYKPAYYFEQKDLEYWNSIKKVVCITKEYRGSTYNGGVIVGEIYDVVEYVANVHPNGRFRIKGKLEGIEYSSGIRTSDLFPKELFITLEQHRQNQLEKIL